MFGSHFSNKKQVFDLLHSVIGCLISHKLLDISIRLSKEFEKRLNDEDILEKIKFMFICGAIDYSKKNHLNGKNQMENAIEIFRTVKSFRLANSYQISMDKLISND